LDLRGKSSDWKELHNGELHEYPVPNIVRAIKTRRVRFTEHVARMDDKYILLIDRRITIKLI
jgi:hypothetical protein